VLARRGLAPALAAAGVVAAGCGAAPPDLFLLTRSGSVPGARLTLVVSDGGTVRCNGGRPRSLPDPRLLDARALARDLDHDAKRDRRLAPGPNGVLRYRLRLPDGSVAFGDTSRGLPAAYRRVEAFTRAVARGVCRLPR
jgi:hypothetical protein